ncbi:P1 family peptidase [Novosphingobium pokkalii]|jgi:L-aminopeptidase/D-esterase-like protein|uniref:P1 family peptidase n=1 Tax=Novosphingobium pokkalii TaxID=1770194 RepID=A0ABV7V2I2_9SPHN|nr:P1 family peptidase [Novosphingobium pokkalii]GHC85197.1 peptidase T4 [Novosphingobium pokkalii]
MNRRQVLASTGMAAPLALGGARAMAHGGPASGRAPSGGPAHPGRTGPRNLITDVPGITVGCAQDAAVRTGTTVILAEGLVTAAIDVRGGGPGTRESDALESHNLVHACNAVVLSGGSSWGLAAADGVAAQLGARGIGYGGLAADGVPVSPIVPAAILYDLGNGGNKRWGTLPPYRDLGMAALAAAGPDFALGTSGAGYGAMAGALKGGLGSASTRTRDGVMVGAIVAVNALGSSVVPGTRHFWAGAFEMGDEFGGLGPVAARVGAEEWGGTKLPAPRENTTIACIATDLDLTAAEMKRVAIMAQDGLARALRPVHTPFDGDVVFALSTARRAVTGSRDLAVLTVGAVAADTLARAIARGVHAASAPAGWAVPTWSALPTFSAMPQG